MSNKHLEDDFQAAVMKWANLYRMPDHEDLEKNSKLSDYLFAVPNGGKRNVREAARLKRQGVKAGVHDLMLNIARNCYYGLDMELKIGTNKLTPKQVEWRDRMTRAGRLTAVCYDIDQVKEIIDEYIKS